MVHPFFQERSFVSQTFLLPSCVFIQRKKCNILPLFPLIHIQRSTFHRRSPVPLSLQNGKRFAFFSLWSFCILIFSSENCLQKFRTSLSAVFSRHSYTQFSNLSFLPIKNLLSQGIYPCGKRFLLAYLISRLSREHP